jgi:glutathione peroxidase
MYKVLILILLSISIHSSEFYKFKAKDIKGKDVDFSKYKGSPVLIVNVASQCGYTGQYKNIENLNKEYSSKGLKIIGFPSNDFGGQEPGTDSEIAEFCKNNYGVSFDMMSKISVKGKSKNPIYQFLLSNAPNKEEIAWNFEKFLLDKKGNIVARYPSSVVPDSSEVKTKINNLLLEK